MTPVIHVGTFFFTTLLEHTEAGLTTLANLDGYVTTHMSETKVGRQRQHLSSPRPTTLRYVTAAHSAKADASLA